MWDEAQEGDSLQWPFREKRTFHDQLLGNAEGPSFLADFAVPEEFTKEYTKSVDCTRSVVSTLSEEIS